MAVVAVRDGRLVGGLTSGDGRVGGETTAFIGFPEFCTDAALIGMHSGSNLSKINALSSAKSV